MSSSEDSTIINTKIKVDNISPLVDEQVLHDFFSFIGPVLNVTINVTYTSHEGTKDAIVEFERDEDAKLAVYLTGTEIADRSVLIIRYEEKKESKEALKYLRTVFVANLHPSTREDDLKRFFTACGRQSEIKLVRDIGEIGGVGGSGDIKGKDGKDGESGSDGGLKEDGSLVTLSHALVEFISETGVKAALELNSRYLLDKSIFISRVNSELKPIDPIPVPKPDATSNENRSVYSSSSKRRERSRESSRRDDYHHGSSSSGGRRSNRRSRSRTPPRHYRESSRRDDYHRGSSSSGGRRSNRRSRSRTPPRYYRHDQD